MCRFKKDAFSYDNPLSNDQFLVKGKISKQWPDCSELECTLSQQKVWVIDYSRYCYSC